MAKIIDLQDGMKRVNVEATLVEINETRVVKSRYKDEEYQLADATIADDTGSIKLTLWNEDIEKARDKVGTIVKIDNGYVTSFKGEIQLNVGKFGTLTFC